MGNGTLVSLAVWPADAPYKSRWLLAVFGIGKLTARRKYCSLDTEKSFPFSSIYP